METTGTLRVSEAGDRAIVMTRIFDAPRDLVFNAITRPEYVKRWLSGTGGWTMEVCDIDLRTGGGYRYVWTRPGSADMGMRGEFLEVDPPVRIVQTEVFDDAWYPGRGAVATTELTEAEGRTTLTLTVEYESAEARDFVLRTPMAGGVEQGYDRLAALLAER